MHTEMVRVVVVQDICARFVLMRLETVSSSLVDTALLASSAGHGNKIGVFFCLGFKSDGVSSLMWQRHMMMCLEKCRIAETTGFCPVCRRKIRKVKKIFNV